MPRLDNCQRVFSDFNVELVEKLFPRWQKTLPQYSMELIKPYGFNEVQDNPKPKNWRDDLVFIPRQGDCGVKCSLTKMRHQNFDFSVVLLKENLYVVSGVYYYSHYIADQLQKLIMKQSIRLNKDDFNDFVFEMESYKDWSEHQKDAKTAIHNYKVDIEDLRSISVEV